MLQAVSRAAARATRPPSSYTEPQAEATTTTIEECQIHQIGVAGLKAGVIR